jgi:hypothetical protein
MRTEDLIADLASHTTPVRPLRSPGIRALVWLGIAIAFGAAGLVIFGPRPNLRLLVTQPDFLWTATLALATVVFAAMAALVLAIPGAERSPLLRTTTVAIVGLWAVTLATAIVRADHGFTGVSHWYVCFLRIVAIGLVPAIAAVAMLRRAAALRPGWTGALAMAAAAAVGALAIQFICPLDDAAHALVGHFGAVVAAGAVGALGARPLLNTGKLRISSRHG